MFVRTIEAVCVTASNLQIAVDRCLHYDIMCGLFLQPAQNIAAGFSVR